MCSIPSRPGLLPGILWEFLVGNAVSFQRGLETENGKWLRWPNVPGFESANYPLSSVGLGLKSTHPMWACAGRAYQLLWVEQTSLSLMTHHICSYGKLSINPGIQILMMESQFSLLWTMSSGAGCHSNFSFGFGVRSLHIWGWLCAYLWDLSRSKWVDTSLPNYVIWEWASGSFPRWGAIYTSSLWLPRG